MCPDYQCRSVSDSFKSADNVADLILMHVRNACSSQKLSENLSSFFFVERRSRNFGQLNLFVDSLLMLLFCLSKSFFYRRTSSKFCD